MESSHALAGCGTRPEGSEAHLPPDKSRKCCTVFSWRGETCPGHLYLSSSSTVGPESKCPWDWSFVEPGTQVRGACSPARQAVLGKSGKQPCLLQMFKQRMMLQERHRAVSMAAQPGCCCWAHCTADGCTEGLEEPLSWQWPLLTCTKQAVDFPLVKDPCHTQVLCLPFPDFPAKTGSLLLSPG